MHKFLLTCSCVFALVPAPLNAQVKEEDGADDAFGRRVGIESIGLYNEGQVRGFNLENAGNYRIEGHYFARAGSPQFVIRSATVTRIGANALRYDFPAPSGVVEFNLRSAPPGNALSVEVGTRAYGGPFADVVGSAGRTDGKAGVIAGLNFAPAQRYVNGARGEHVGGGLVGRLSVTDKVKLSAFATVSDWVADPDTGIVPQGDFLPSRIKRGVYRGQRWSKFDSRQQTAGLFGTAALAGGWELNGAAFHSAVQADRSDFHLLSLQDREGEYRSYAFVSPRRSTSAKSASLSLSRGWGSESFRQRVVATVRYRDTTSANSSSFVFDLGSGDLGDDYAQVPEPDIPDSGSRALDRTDQKTAGIGYRVTIGGDIELRADVQKTHYDKTRIAVGGERTRGKSAPWLYTGSAAWAVSDKLSIFGSYSRGLEESGVAPNSASNRGEVLPAVIATQREIGARYELAKSLSLIGGLFDTRKETPGTGPDGRFGLIGEVRHRGFEASLAGALSPRLNVVAGLMLLDATVDGNLVDAGLIGSKAIGRPDKVGLVNMTWTPGLVDGLSLDANLSHQGARYMNTSNKVESPTFSTLDLGVRYAFKAYDQPLVLRARAVNVFDAFAWQPDAGGTLFPNPPRGFHLSIRADV